MNNINWIEAFNSMTTFGILVAIATLLVLLVLKKDARSKPSKR